MPDGMARLSRFGPDAAYEWMFQGRHKFQHYRTWIQRECATCVGAILLGGAQTSLEEYIDFSRVKKILADHLNGKRNYTEEIDRVATIVLADRLLLQQAAKPQSTGQRIRRRTGLIGAGEKSQLLVPENGTHFHLSKMISNSDSDKRVEIYSVSAPYLIQRNRACLSERHGERTWRESRYAQTNIIHYGCGGYRLGNICRSSCCHN